MLDVSACEIESVLAMVERVVGLDEYTISILLAVGDAG